MSLVYQQFVFVLVFVVAVVVVEVVVEVVVGVVVVVVVVVFFLCVCVCVYSWELRLETPRFTDSPKKVLESTESKVVVLFIFHHRIYILLFSFFSFFLISDFHIFMCVSHTSSLPLPPSLPQN